MNIFPENNNKFPEDDAFHQAVKINVEMSKTRQYDQTRVDQTNVPRSKGVPKKLQKNVFSGIIFGKVAGLVPQLCLQKTT